MAQTGTFSDVLREETAAAYDELAEKAPCAEHYGCPPDCSGRDFERNLNRALAQEVREGGSMLQELVAKACQSVETDLAGMGQVNLKQMLMELGNKLVTERGFMPSTTPFETADSTYEIRRFTDWLNRTPAAREVLAELGVEWPVVPHE